MKRFLGYILCNFYRNTKMYNLLNTLSLIMSLQTELYMGIVECTNWGPITNFLVAFMLLPTLQLFEDTLCIFPCHGLLCGTCEQQLSSIPANMVTLDQYWSHTG